MVLPPFARLVEAYGRDVTRLCAALAGPDDAEDAAQRAWLNALQAYRNLRHARNLRGWLLKIAANAAMDTHRDRARRPVPVTTLGETAAGVVSPADPPSGDLWTHVRALPARQRAAIVLRYGFDLSHDQIASMLDCTPTMSRRLVSDGLAALRQTVPTQEEVTT